jgi:mRNA-degrading endonuclease RelE of RelBE toxin-antitoxin system
MSKTNQPWYIEKPDNFYNKQVKILPFSVQKKLQSIMTDLIHSYDPTKLGTLKITKYGHAYVADLSDSYRLAYIVDSDNRTIQIIRVGDHKKVYGKD